MKKLFVTGLLLTSLFLLAQSPEKIVDDYFKSLGGDLEKVHAILQKGKMKINGMEFPMENYQDTSGKIYSKINMMGKEITVVAFDGKNGYMFDDATFSYRDIPDSLKQDLREKARNIFGYLYNYKQNKTELKYLGLQKIDGKELQAVKARFAKPIEGKVQEMILYFNPDTHLIELMKVYAGDIIGYNKIPEYKNFDGYYFPAKIITEVDGVEVNNITFDQIIVNPPEPDPSVFIKPEN